MTNKLSDKYKLLSPDNPEDVEEVRAALKRTLERDEAGSEVKDE